MGWSEDSPEAGDFSGVATLANRLGGFADWLDNASASLQSGLGSVRGSWSGEACNAWVTTGEALAHVMAAKSSEVRHVASAASTYLATVPGELVPEVKLLKRKRERAQAELLAAQMRVTSLASDGAAAASASPDATRMLELQQEIDDCDRSIRAWCEVRHAADQAFAGAISGADLGSGSILSDLGITVPAGVDFGGASFGLPMTVRGGTGMGAAATTIMVEVPAWWIGGSFDQVPPERVREEWDQLTDLQREALIKARPSELGNFDGIPLGWRTKANRINIQNEIDRLNAEIEEIEGSRPVGRTGMPRGTFQLPKKKEQIEYLQSLLNGGQRTETWVNGQDQWGCVQYGPDSSLSFSSGSQVISFDLKNQSIAIYHGTFD